MRKNELIRCGDTFFRVLDMDAGKVLVIDCVRRTVPKWLNETELNNNFQADEADLSEVTGISPSEISKLDAESKRIAHERFTMIAGILPFIGSERDRNLMIGQVAERYKVSRQTVRNTLCLYLNSVFQQQSVKQCLRYV